MLVEGGDVHPETPPNACKHVSPGWQFGWQAVDRVMLDAVHHLAYAPLGIHPVQAAILPAGIFSAHLKISLQAPEVPINIIGGSNVGAHIPHFIGFYF